MHQTPPKLLAPYKAPVIEHARALLRAAGTDGMTFEIPGMAVPCMIVLGAQDRIGQLLRAESLEPMLGGRRAGDPPAPVLNFDEPEPDIDGPPMVDSPDLVMIRGWLRAVAEAGRPVTLSGMAAAALYYAMDTGKPMEPDRTEE